MEVYRYLNALTNLVKHRHLVPIIHRYKLDPSPGVDGKMIFMSFEMKGVPYAEKEILSFFDEFHDPVFSAVLNIGHQLNISLNLET